MRLIDLHCDTVFELFRRRERGSKENALYAGIELEQTPGCAEMQLGQNSLCVDIEKMKRANSMAQFFACFIYMKWFQGEDRFSKAYSYALDMLSFAKQEFEEYPEEIALVKSYDELIRNEKEGKISAFLTVEEGGIIENDRNRLEYLDEQGVRLMTLLWNEENCMGYPNSRDDTVMKKGLKSFGIETVEHMNKLGMMIDVSRPPE